MVSEEGMTMSLIRPTVVVCLEAIEDFTRSSTSFFNYRRFGISNHASAFQISPWRFFRTPKFQRIRGYCPGVA